VLTCVGWRRKFGRGAAGEPRQRAGTAPAGARRSDVRGAKLRRRQQRESLGELREEWRGLAGAGVVRASWLGRSVVMESGDGGQLGLEPCARNGSEARELGAREANGRPSGAGHARRERTGARACGAWPGLARPAAWARCTGNGGVEGPASRHGPTVTISRRPHTGVKRGSHVAGTVQTRARRAGRGDDVALSSFIPFKPF
jgi:hypothetical protein